MIMTGPSASILTWGFILIRPTSLRINIWDNHLIDDNILDDNVVDDGIWDSHVIDANI